MPKNQLVKIPGGTYRLSIEHKEQGSLIRLLDDANGEPLCLEIGPSGPVLHLDAGLTIAVTGELRFNARRVNIHGQDEVKLHSQGAICLHSDGDMFTESRELRMRARLGDIRMSANDDIKLSGERIRLNC